VLNDHFLPAGFFAGVAAGFFTATAGVLPFTGLETVSLAGAFLAAADS